MEMNDKEFLNWIYERLVHVHKENHNADFMHRLKKIIDEMETTNKKQTSGEVKSNADKDMNINRSSNKTETTLIDTKLAYTYKHAFTHQGEFYSIINVLDVNGKWHTITLYGNTEESVKLETHDNIENSCHRCGKKTNEPKVLKDRDLDDRHTFCKQCWQDILEQEVEEVM